MPGSLCFTPVTGGESETLQICPNSESKNIEAATAKMMSIKFAVAASSPLRYSQQGGRCPRDVFQQEHRQCSSAQSADLLRCENRANRPHSAAEAVIAAAKHPGGLANLPITEESSSGKRD